MKLKSGKCITHQAEDTVAVDQITLSELVQMHFL